MRNDYQDTIAEDHGSLKVGHHDPETCPNCIIERAFKKLSEGDLFALEWFGRNVTSFSLEANLVLSLIDNLGLEGTAREVFLLKLNAIYQSIRNQQTEKIKNG